VSSLSVVAPFVSPATSAAKLPRNSAILQTVCARSYRGAQVTATAMPLTLNGTPFVCSHLNQRAPLPIQHRSHLIVLSMLCSKRRRRREDHLPERQRGFVQWLAASQLHPSLLRRARRRWRDRQCHRVAVGALPVHDHVRPPSLQRLVAARPHKPCGETRSMRSKWACSGPPPPPPAVPEDQRACCQYVPRCTQTPLAE